MTSNAGLVRRVFVHGSTSIGNTETKAYPAIPLASLPITSNDVLSQNLRKKKHIIWTVLSQLFRPHQIRRPIIRSRKKARARPGARSVLLYIIFLTTFCITLHHSDKAKLPSQTTPIFIQFKSPRSQLFLAPPLGVGAKDEAVLKDYGGVYIPKLKVDTLSQPIAVFYENQQDRNDAMLDYYAFDDDFVRNRYLYDPEEAFTLQRRCRRTNWHRLVFPTCNSMHELALEYPASQEIMYLTSGSYRNVFSLAHRYLESKETVVVKQFQQSWDFHYDSYECARMDALVAERLTASPRIADIYSYCGLSSVTEFFINGDGEATMVPLYPWRKAEPQRNLTASDKLKVALNMAEAIADLHGFEDGVIVHNDIQPPQFFFSDDWQTLKLNDFNRAEVMLWDEEHQEYCRYRNGPGPGNYRSPEEYLDKPLNEKIDVWSFGNNLHALLHGQYVFNGQNDDVAKTSVMNGTWAFLDPVYRSQSFAEGKLVELIERCWEFDADQRPDMFELVQILREAVIENERLEKVEHGELHNATVSS